jgi:hypothetical protein
VRMATRCGSENVGRVTGRYAITRCARPRASVLPLAGDRTMAAGISRTSPAATVGTSVSGTRSDVKESCGPKVVECLRDRFKRGRAGPSDASMTGKARLRTGGRRRSGFVGLSVMRGLLQFSPLVMTTVASLTPLLSTNA